MARSVNETEWSTGSPRKVVVKVRRIENKRKRLLSVCAMFNHFRNHLVRPALPIAFDLLERFADGMVGDAHHVRAKGLIRDFDWVAESLPGNTCLDLIAITQAAISTDTDNIEMQMPILKSVAIQATLLRDIFGNPFRPVTFDPSWRSDTAVSLARHVYESREFSAMPILADALQDAGCDHADVLDHCRDAKQIHVRGCWVVDLVLGKS